MTLTVKGYTQFLCRLKKVQGKKKRDAEKAEAARKLKESAEAGEADTGDEFGTAGTPLNPEQTGDLLNDKDEDVIF